MRNMLDGRYDEIKSGRVMRGWGRVLRRFAETRSGTVQAPSLEMSSRQGFQLHPGAAQDITEIWEFIAKDSVAAAGRVREELLDAVRKLVVHPKSRP